MAMPKLNVNPAAYIVLDLFPASVFLDGENIGTELKAIVTDNTFYAFSDGPTIVIETPLLGFSGKGSTGYTVETENGTYTVLRSGDCGCGTRLRGYHPFLYVPYEGKLR